MTNTTSVCKKSRRVIVRRCYNISGVSLLESVVRHSRSRQSALLIKYRWGEDAGHRGARGAGAQGGARGGPGGVPPALHSAARRAAKSTLVRARGPWSREPMRACSGAMVTATRTACGAWPTCGAPADVSSAPPTARTPRASPQHETRTFTADVSGGCEISV